MIQTETKTTFLKVESNIFKRIINSLMPCRTKFYIKFLNDLDAAILNLILTVQYGYQSTKNFVGFIEGTVYSLFPSAFRGTIDLEFR